MPTLRHWCKDSALAQMRAVAAAREIEGLTMAGTILNVQKAELVQAKSLEKGVPIILVTSQVQYIHCVRNKKVSQGNQAGRHLQ
jgi:Tim44-like domain